jgi:hypothetical protein
MTAVSPDPSASERPPPTNVIQAIARVMEDAPAVGKDGKFSGGGTSYNFRSIEGVTAALQKIMGRYCVVAVPKVVERTTRAFEQNAKPWTEENLTLIYTVYGPGGVSDSIEVGPLYALGRDNSDKGTNKAMSQAYKQALVQLFVIGDSKDDGDSERAEADSHTRRHSPPAEPQLSKEQELGWADATACKAAHDAVIGQIKALSPDVDRSELNAYRASKGMPMSPDDLSGLARLIDDLVAAQHEAPKAAFSTGQPEAAAPAPEAPVASTHPLGVCPWCEKEVGSQGSVITGGTNPDDPAQRWHKKPCWEEKMAEQESAG